MNIPVAQYTTSVTAATAAGVVTVTDASGLAPGANAWLALSDGSNQVRVKILSIKANVLIVRGYKDNRDEGAIPSYGRTDVSAFNGASYISMEAQTVPVNPAFASRSFA
jgi:hypothetical protein